MSIQTTKYKFINGKRVRAIRDKICVVCSNVFTPLVAKQKYCGRDCYYQMKRIRHDRVNWTPEMRDRMSKAYMGKGNPMYGVENWAKGKKRPEITGNLHAHWKGGYWINEDGYKVIQNEVETQGHKLFEHRKVMEKFLGRKLLSSELIHHINHNKLDNRINNLQIVTRSEHPKIHAYNKNTEKWLINYYQGI